MLTELSEWTEIINVTKQTNSKSLQSDFKDFEDVIQYHSALSVKEIDLIVTRNPKDYKTSSLPILNPTEAVVLITSLL